MSSDILKYSILNDVLSLANSLPIPLAGGSASLSKDQEIFYFGGYSNAGFDQSIFKYDPITNTISNAGLLPNATWGNIAISSNSGSIFLFSGTGVEQDIVKYENSSSSKIDDIPAINGTSIRPRSAVWDDASGHTILFASATTQGGIVVKYDTEENTVDDIVTVESPVQMFFNGGTAWDADAKKGYIIGGFYFRDASSPVGILEYDPDFESFSLLKVKDFPGSVGNKRYSKGAVAYVKKMDRIYIFGGFTGIDYSVAEEHDKIWYVDLKP
jgi:hypothetical protein